MRRLLISTALVAAAGGAAIAQDGEGMFRAETDPNAIHASEFIGMRVYRSEQDADSVEGLQDEWDDIGEIHDIVLTRDGEIDAVLVDIGGFLGIGENRVAVDMDSVRFVSDDATAEDDGDFFLVLNAPVSALEEAPAYEGGMSMTGGADMDAGMTTETATMPAETDAETAEAELETEMAEAEAEVEGEMAEAEATLEGAAAEAGAELEQAGEAIEGEMAEAEAEVEGEIAEANTELDEQPEVVSTQVEAELETTDGEVETDTAAGTSSPVGYGAGLVEREGYTNAPLEDLTSETLTGAPAYDSNDERIGEVSEILLSGDGTVESVIVDVGGFLGIGEKPVQLELSQIDILRTDAGDDTRVYIAMTEEELEAMPDYEG